MSSKTKEVIKDFLKWAWYIGKASLIAGNGLLVAYFWVTAKNVDIVVFWMIVYGAFQTSTIIFGDKHIGTWTQSEIEGAHKQIKDTSNQATQTAKISSNQEAKDLALAQKEGKSLEEYSKEKYGSETYWQDKKNAELQSEKEKEIARKEAELAAEKARLEAEKKALQPTPQEVKK